MNKSAIEKYAVWARTEMISKVKQRAYRYGITEDGYGEREAVTVVGQALSTEEQKQRKELVDKISQMGYEQVMEETAYTWFNRFIALRFMEVNNYLPSHIRVFSDSNGDFKPEIIGSALHLELPGLDREKVASYIESNQTEELYRYLLLTQCNALNEALPGMFEKMGGYTELLFPDNILRDDSVLARLVTDIPEEDWTDQVQIIGWLYQYYISARHEEVVDLFSGKAIKKEDIPAATQLFTKDWVVKYTVDNSLGRYWIERHPESRLAEKLEFLVTPKSGKLQTIEENVKPEELKFFDPCMGSGHILVYAFDMLMEIYKECGYAERDAASEIIRNNLFGLDIDERCSQLAYFAVMMKGRSYDRRFLTRGITPHVMAIRESNGLRPSSNYGFMRDMSQNATWDYLIRIFENAKEIGTLQTVECKKYDSLKKYMDDCEHSAAIDMSFTEWMHSEKTVMEYLIKQAEIMCGKYAVVCTNPPYLNKIDKNLKEFVNANYKDYFGDLFSVFMYRNFEFCQNGGYSAFMTPFVWMFIKTYEKLREFIIRDKHIVSLIQMEYSAFEEATVPICTFVLQNGKSNAKSLCFRLSEFKGGMDVQRQKVLEALLNPECGYFYEADQSNFSKIPGSPVAYWVRDTVLNCFTKDCISNIGWTSKGIITGNNDMFLRLWHEVNFINVNFFATNYMDALYSCKKWYPCNKGGEYRKWYGNKSYVINWYHNGEEIMQRNMMKVRNCQDYKDNMKFTPSITWTSISSAKPSFRISKNMLSESAGMTLFIDESHICWILPFLNSKVADYLLVVINPTLNFTAGSVSKLPLALDELKKVNVIADLSEYSTLMSKLDWDSNETSWDFKKHPIV